MRTNKGLAPLTGEMRTIHDIAGRPVAMRWNVDATAFELQAGNQAFTLNLTEGKAMAQGMLAALNTWREQTNTGDDNDD